MDAPWRVLAAAFLAMLMAVSPAWPAAAAAAGGFELRNVSYTAGVDLWPEQPIGPGTSLRVWEMQTAQGPQRVSMVGADLTNPWVEVKVSAAGPSVVGRETVSRQAARDSRSGHQVIAAVNGDFFDTTAGYAGVPNGLFLLNGEMKVNPWGSALAIDIDGRVSIGEPVWQGRVEVLDSLGQVVSSVRIDGVNRRREVDRLILYTPSFGTTTRTNDWGVEVTLTGLAEPLAPQYQSAGVAREVEIGTAFAQGQDLESPGRRLSRGDAAVPWGTMVLSGHGDAGRFLLEQVGAGARVRIVSEIDEPWRSAASALGGDPVLVVDGQVQKVGPGAPQALRAAPRTAAGIDQQGRMVLITVDGRQSGSYGLTLPQFAVLLQQLGLRDAINLDGGGSTTAFARPAGHLTGRVLNIPSDVAERPVANSLQVISRAPAGQRVDRLWIEPDGLRMLPGVSRDLVVRAQDEFAGPVAVPAEDVAWTVHGGGQGAIEGAGRFRALGPGPVQVQARWQGQEHVAGVTVLSTADVVRTALVPDLTAQPPVAGAAVPLAAAFYDQAGRSIDYAPDSLVWQADEELGRIESGSRLALRTPFAEGHLRLGMRLPGIAGDPAPLAEWFLTVGERPADPAVPMFPDTENHWAETDVALLVSRGVVNGYPDGHFRPDGTVTRAELSKMLVGALMGPDVLAAGPDALPFSDRSTVPIWAGGAVMAGVQAGLIAGFEDGTFRPADQVTREQAVAMTVRALSMAPGGQTGSREVRGAETEFADLDAISPWARGAAVAGAAEGLVHGFEDGTFRPLLTLTRGQAAALIVRLTGGS
ncbi:MAG: S-layer homology domain-containing protein [Thermaerobacterales bacterium]